MGEYDECPGNCVLTFACQSGAISLQETTSWTSKMSDSFSRNYAVVKGGVFAQTSQTFLSLANVIMSYNTAAYGGCIASEDLASVFIDLCLQHLGFVFIL